MLQQMWDSMLCQALNVRVANDTKIGSNEVVHYDVGRDLKSNCQTLDH